MIQTPARSQSWAGEAYPLATFICALGFFLRILLSGPVLNILGIEYGGDDGGMLSKIHPGSYLILLSFFVLLCSRADPLRQLLRIAVAHKDFFALLSLYALIIFYWLLRDPKGVGLIFDVHIVMPICAIVFFYAPRAWIKPLVYAFFSLAITNSLIGLGEAATHERIFPFDADWELLQQDYFRASALMGHPLTNASFTAISLFAWMSLRTTIFTKTMGFLVMLSSLIAFGGRSALLVSLILLGFLGLSGIKTYLTHRRLTLLRLLTLFLATILVPAACLALLYGALQSGIGERLMAYNSLQDDSAGVRLLALQVFDYISPSDMLLGLSGDRVNAVIDQIGLANPTSDIENPWILMFLLLGGVMFTLWICALGVCLKGLMTGAPLSLQLALVAYFTISSTSNSFGRKDPGYLLVIGLVILMKRLLEIDRPQHSNQSLTD